MRAEAKLQRETFEIGRELEFFTEKELEMQIGHEPEWWPIALFKELIDNALDACEGANVTPEVAVEVQPDAFSVQDNGPGLPAETLVGSLDYLKRVSDKSFYVAPTRGQLGNALKVVWAAPFVVSGEVGRVEAWTPGQHHEVMVSLDRLRGRPAIEHTVREDGFVKNGTLIKVHWPDSARLLRGDENADSYNPPMIARELVEGFAAFNPHASFRFWGVGAAPLTFEATDTNWCKWRPDEPTSAHWYTRETLRDLVAAYVAKEQEGGRVRTAREFVSEFRGLSSTAKQKTVMEGLGLSGVYLHDLVANEDVDMALVTRLLAAMQAAFKPPQPAALGIIGQEHVTAWMTSYAGVTRESVRYRKKLGLEEGMPFALELAYGVRADNDCRREVTGMNWSPSLGIPVPRLARLLGEMMVQEKDPITVFLHMARPRFEFVDHGKTQVKL